MRTRLTKVSGLLLLFLTVATPRVASAAAGPMILSGLAPDAFGHFDGDQCRGCNFESEAAGLCKRKKTKNLLHKASRRMVSFNFRVRSLAGRQNIGPETAAALRALGEPILADMRTLLRAL